MSRPEIGYQRLLLLLLWLPWIITPAPLSAATKSSESCDSFRKLLDARSLSGIERYQLEKSLPVGGNPGDERYFNLDIDGDDINDNVVSSCSSSSMPADPCILSVQSSSGKKLTFQENTFYLIRYRSRVFAIANHRGANVNVGNRNIYLVSGAGVKLICSKL